MCASACVRACVCMCVCLYVFVYACVFVCVIYTHMHAHTSAVVDGGHCHIYKSFIDNLYPQVVGFQCLLNSGPHLKNVLENECCRNIVNL